MSNDLPRMPSLDVIRTELDGLLVEQERRASAFDSRAGLVLGFGGALIGLTATDPTLMQLLAQVAAAAAAALAGWSLWPRVANAVGPRELRERYLMIPTDRTKLAVLDTRIQLYESDEQRLLQKVFRLKLATYALALAVLLLLIGAIVDYIR